MGQLSFLAVVATIPIVFSEAQFYYSQYPNHPLNIGPVQATYTSFPFNNVPLQSNLRNVVPLTQTYTTTYDPNVMGNR